MKRKMLVCGLVMSMAMSSLLVSAAAPRSASDCKASISLTASKGVFQVYENTTPMNPITPKKIDGTYQCIDINGYYNTQVVRKSISSGQLVETRYAPDHFKTYMGKMAYYLNGIYAGSVEKRY